MSNMNVIKDTLGNRMKEYYENIPKTKLMRRTPVCVRIDGRAFHTYAKHFNKPFDEILIKTMQQTSKYLCENVEGCVLSYCQSDEISLLLIDYKKLNSGAFFDYEVQKVCSIIASMATMYFNKMFESNVNNFYRENAKLMLEDNKINELGLIYQKAMSKGAMFDSRCFNIPKEEVTNYFYWRQLDASRNSIQMLAQSLFSHKELQNKSCAELQDMMVLQKGVNWNDLETYNKRGSCVIKEDYIDACGAKEECFRSRWIIDKDIPIFKGDGREYIEKLINIK